MGTPFFDLTGPLVLSAAGTARVPLDVPAGAPGVSLFLQGVVIDPQSPSGLATFSNGVEMKIPPP